MPPASLKSAANASVAGNSISAQYLVEIDAEAPALAILSPAEGSTVADTIEVVVSSDPETWIDLALGGTPIATLAGPDARTTIDASHFPLGRMSISASARDAAGNRSAPASIEVIKVE